MMYDMVWFDMIFRFDTMYDMVWFDILYVIIGNDMRWCDMISYGMKWYDMIYIML